MKLEIVILILSIATVFNVLILHWIIDSIIHRVNVIDELLLDIQEHLGMGHDTRDDGQFKGK